MHVVEFSPENDMIVTGSDDKSINRSSTATREQVGEPLLHNHEIFSFSLSDHGTVITSCTFDGGLYCWDTISGQLIRGFPCEQITVPYFWTNNDGTK